MIYNDYKGEKISALGMGCMRLPRCGDKDSDIDVAATAEMVDYAMGHGVNYFDTAWGYHDGKSETVMGEILSNYQRESFYLASKFPGYDLKLMDKVEEIFEKQLERCKTDYFDFYLFHNVCEMNINKYLDEKYGILEYLLEQKKRGRIKHLGFSTHGNYNTMKRFLDAYGEHMEFCQIQVNWLDWIFQRAKEKVEIVSEYNIPVWVMEPVRGGSLAALDPEHEAILKELRPAASITEWSFRFLQTIPAVVTLSGMSNLEQLKENISVYEEAKPLNDTEMAALEKIVKEKIAKKALPCTACKYCTSHCPKGLNIPLLINLYNEHIYSGGGFIAPMALRSMSENELPSACIGCRACESVCPQGIEISKMMKHFTEKTR